MNIKDIDIWGDNPETTMTPQASNELSETQKVKRSFKEPDSANPGYHTWNIYKGQIGKFNKISEEFLEAADAHDQRCKIMVLIELSDLYGAMREYLKNFNLTMQDLEVMADVTKRAFESGRRKESD